MASLPSTRVGIYARAQCQQLVAQICPVCGAGRGDTFFHALSQCAFCSLQPREATPFLFNVREYAVSPSLDILLGLRD